LVSAGEAELAAFGISYFDGLLFVFVAGDDGSFGVVQWF